MTRVAAIDCGTNSIRLLIADIDSAMTPVDRDGSDMRSRLMSERGREPACRYAVDHVGCGGHSQTRKAAQPDKLHTRPNPAWLHGTLPSLRPWRPAVVRIAKS